MGNNVCTDQKPFTLEDVRRTKDEYRDRKARGPGAPLILQSTQQAYEKFGHHVKAFCFRMGASGSGESLYNHDAAAVNHGASPAARRSNVTCTPVALRDRVAVDPGAAYIVLHIKRTDAGELLVPTRGDEDADNVPDWAANSFAAFTPRGLATPFGIDIAAIRWRGRNSEERYKFEYSLHVYNGRASHQLTVAVATMQAFQLEKLLMNDVELLQRLFYGFNAAHPSDLSLPVTVAELDFSDARITSSLRCELPLRSVLQQHALLRNLHFVRFDPPVTTLTPDTAGTVTLTPQTIASCPRVSERSSTTDTDVLLPQANLAVVGGDAFQNANELPQESRVTVDRANSGKPSISLKLNLAAVPALGPRSHEPAIPVGKVDDDADEVEETRRKMELLRDLAPQATEVLPWLFVGGEIAAKDKTQLIEKGITHIVNTTAHSIPNYFPQYFEYTSINLCDSPDEPIFSLFPLVNRVIEEARSAGGKVFIHCHQGVSRSCSLVIAYVMWKQGVCYDRAYAQVRERRTICSPNSGFYVNLLRWEKHLSSRPKQMLLAFLPFSKEYAFPLTFREVPINENRAILDPRIAYGVTSVPTGTSDATDDVTVALIRTRECSELYYRTAFVALEAHLKYNYYTGLPKTSTTNLNVEVRYLPCTLMRKRIEEVDWNSPRCAAILGTSLEVSREVDVSVSALLRRNMDELLEQNLDDAQRVQERAAERKRYREEELTTGSAGAVRQVVQAWAPSSDSAATSSALREASSSQGPLLVDGDESEQDGDESVRVFQFPFDSSDTIDVSSIDDLSTDNGYAIAVCGCRGRLTSPTHRRPHRVFLWLGEEFTKDEETLQAAFRQSVGPGGPLHDVRLTNRTALRDVDVEFVYERDEPSDLLLAFA